MFIIESRSRNVRMLTADCFHSLKMFASSVNFHYIIIGLTQCLFDAYDTPYSLKAHWKITFNEKSVCVSVSYMLVLQRIYEMGWV